jgi:hypothetical protein
MTTKQCSKCRETKALDDFHLDRRSANRRQSWCRACKHDRRTRSCCSRCGDLTVLQSKGTALNLYVASYWERSCRSCDDSTGM